MKAYVMLADGFEEIEGLSVVDVLRRGEVETIMVSVKDERTVKSARNIEIAADTVLDGIIIEKDDMIVLPGGLKGVRGLEASEALIKTLNEHQRRKGWIAAICAGPSIPGKLGFYKGLKATCYPGFEHELLGAEFVEEDVVVDGNFVTARAAGMSLAFAFTLLRILKGPEMSEKIQKAMLFKGENA